MAELEKKETTVTLFAREQLRACKEFEDKKDLVSALMQEDEQISKEELRKRIKNFLERSTN
ncbi:MAG: hypothetical protein KH020_07250 [Clostridiales bacterium]|nr:hypothetical protein [Clostridiales bacterium]